MVDISELENKLRVRAARCAKSGITLPPNFIGSFLLLERKDLFNDSQVRDALALILMGFFDPNGDEPPSWIPKSEQPKQIHPPALQPRDIFVRNAGARARKGENTAFDSNGEPIKRG